MPFDGREFRVETRAELELRILREARDGIARPEFWVQRSLEIFGARCAIGWVMYAGLVTGHESAWRLPTKLLWPALPWYWRIATLKNRHGTVARFNDMPWRSHRRMVRLYDRAIRLAKRRC